MKCRSVVSLAEPFCGSLSAAHDQARPMKAIFVIERAIVVAITHRHFRLCLVILAVSSALQQACLVCLGDFS